MKRISWFAIKAKGKKEHEQNKTILGMGKKKTTTLKLFEEGRLKFSKGCENHSEISNTVNNNEGERELILCSLLVLPFSF